jgi:hypothetical protein
MADDKNKTPSAEDKQTGKAGDQTSFTAITTQDDFDRAVAARLARERSKYEGYDDYKKAAEKLAKIEEEGKTEVEKLRDKTADLEGKLKAFELKEQMATWAAEVSEATGIPAKALRGTTKEELEAHAETLKELYPKDDGKPGAKQPPAPVVPGIGEKTGGAGSTTTDQQFADALAGVL